MSSRLPFDLSALYLNQRRLAELVGGEAFARALANLGSVYDGKARETLEIAAGKDLLLAWLAENKDTVRPIEDRLLTGTATAGMLFTAAGTFRCSGVRRVRPSPTPVAYRDIALPGETTRLSLRLHHGHVAPGSPGDLLTGQVSNLFVVAVADGVTSEVVSAIPIAIGQITELSSRNAVWK